MFATRNSCKQPRMLQTVKKVFKHTQKGKKSVGRPKSRGWTMLKMVWRKMILEAG